MTKTCFALVGWLLSWVALTAGDVLIVADELPAMQFLADKLKTEEKVTSTVVTQAAMPAALDRYAAVVVYLHGKLEAPAEKAFIEYTRAGGRLIALHHSISSGKRKNKEWFSFLGVSLPEGDVDRGGYKWIEPVTLDLVNLAPDHFIMNHKVEYPATVRYEAAGREGNAGERPAFRLHKSEVYLNHVLTEPRTLLMGFRYADEPSGKVYTQNHAGWLRQVGRGSIIYLMPGHSLLDFQNPAYGRIVLNAVVYRP